jgi:hypothetical protein
VEFVKIGHTFPKLQRADKHRHAPKEHGHAKDLFILLKREERALQWENKGDGKERNS